MHSRHLRSTLFQPLLPCSAGKGTLRLCRANTIISRERKQSHNVELLVVEFCVNIVSVQLDE